MAKNTVATLAEMKNNGEKITQLTCYDYSTARLIDEAGINGDHVSLSISDLCALWLRSP